MTSVSARSYVAAGLATAIAGVAVASPVLAQSQIHLPAVSGNVELASEVSSVAQHAVSTGTIEVKQISDAVRHVMASAPHGAATAATALAGGPLVKKAAVTAVARAVTAVVAANPAGSVTVHRDSASSPAVSAALPSLPNLQGILGVPVLGSRHSCRCRPGCLQGVNEATLGLSNVLFGLGIGDQDRSPVRHQTRSHRPFLTASIGGQQRASGCERNCERLWVSTLMPSTAPQWHVSRRWPMRRTPAPLQWPRSR